MRTSLLVIVCLLGAGLLLRGNPAPDFASVPDVRPDPPRNGESIEVPAAYGDIDYEPAKSFYLETLLLQGSVGQKRAAIRELRALGGVDAVNALSFALADEDSRVTEAAIEALAGIGSDDALAVEDDDGDRGQEGDETVPLRCRDEDERPGFRDAALGRREADRDVQELPPVAIRRDALDFPREVGRDLLRERGVR